MYYSPQSETIKKANPNRSHNDLMDSSLKASQVFDGNYWDDFPLPLLLNADTQSVLMLGVGYGAGLRPLLAVKPHLDITGVDLDKISNQTCQSIYTNSFGHVPKLVTAEALTFLKHAEDYYDLIWVDLYDHKGLAPITLTHDFWQTIANRLTSRGSVAINVFGIANHLEPYVDESPLKALAGLMGHHFSRLITAPHRRNTTLIGSNASANLFRQISNSELRSEDLLTLRLQLMRANQLRPYCRNTPESPPVDPSAFTFDRLNELQQKAWGSFLYDLNQQAGTHIHAQFMSPHALVEYLRREETGPGLLDALRYMNSDLITMIPTFLGADVHNHNQPLDWYLDYLRHNADQMESENAHLWYNYFVPQWASMLNSRESLRSRLNQDLMFLLRATS